MNRTVAPPNHHQDGAPEGGEVERLLRGFFRAEMPDPWPSFEAPSQTRAILPFRPASTYRPTALKSRFALAASVALLVGGAWLLGGKLTDRPAETGAPRHHPGTANREFPYVVPPPVIEVKPDGARELKVFIEEAPPPQ